MSENEYESGSESDRESSTALDNICLSFLMTILACVVLIREI